MPLFEFACRKCDSITEVLTRGFRDNARAVACGRCGSRSTVKIVSQVSFKVAKAAKYSEDFLHKARPFLRAQPETARAFDEGKGSEESRTFQLAERIGERIDKTLATRLPARKR
jgi:putative FmdB family regulatory protein